MEFNSKDILNELLDKFNRELDDVRVKLDFNNSKIVELNNFIMNYNKNQDYNEKYFSPRNNENHSNTELSNLKNEVSELLLLNKELIEKENEILLQIEKINFLCNSLNNIDDGNVINKTSNFSILDIQEMDRQRIARELHDNSLQNLSHIIHKIELASLYIDSDPIRAKIELSIIIKNIRNINDEIRNTIFNLRPMTFDDLGFKDTVLRLLEYINEDNKYTIVHSIDDISSDDNLVLVTLFRIIQECVNNIDKHAKADKIILNCNMKDDYLNINICDNGIGFSEKDVSERGNNHFGLKVLNERINLLNGNINIDSKLNEGTIIDINLPINLFMKGNKDEY